MSASEVLSQFAADTAGNVESAYIILYDFRKAETADMAHLPDSVTSKTGAEHEAALKTYTIESAMKAFKASTSSDNAGSLTNSTQSLDSMSGKSGISKILRLQYNPSQFQVYASALAASETDLQGNPNVVNAMQAPSLTLSTAFWFDQATSWDCFPGDKFNGGLAPTNIAKNIGAAVKKKKSSAPTVQETVQAFLAALRDPYTRMVSFRWADFVFTGELLSIGANYTMFSPEGAPVRAQVSLRIQQKQNTDMLKPWYDCFDEVIGCGNSSYTSTSQKLGSVLNIFH